MQSYLGKRESCLRVARLSGVFCLQVPGPPRVRLLVETKALHVSLFQGCLLPALTRPPIVGPSVVLDPSFTLVEPL